MLGTISFLLSAVFQDRYVLYSERAGVTEGDLPLKILMLAASQLCLWFCRPFEAHIKLS